MIHPSTMAGPNWFTTGFGTTNPFQQSSSPFFRSTPFTGGGFGPGNNPFQSQQFGFGTQGTQIQNTINEVLRQALPSILASLGGGPGGGFQTPFTFSGPLGQQGQFGFPTFSGPQGQIGFQTPFGTPGQIGFQTPIGSQGQFGFSNTSGLQGLFGTLSPFGFQTPTGPAQFGPQFQMGFGDQTQNTFWEIVRQSTNGTLQSLSQQIPGLFSQGTLGQTQTSLQNVIGQVCQTLAYCCCYTVAACLLPSGGQAQTQPNFLNFVGQVCQTVAFCCCCCAASTLISSSQTQGTPFNLNTAPQFSGAPGIPTGVGAF